MKHARIVSIVGSIALFVIYVVLSVMASDNSKRASVTSFSQGSFGVSIFAELVEREKKSTLTILKKAILNLEQLREYDALLVLAPTRSFTGREVRIIREYVEQGGTLITSFHSEKTFNALYEIIPNLPELKDASTYNPGMPFEVTTTEGDTQLPTHAKMRFYSHQFFDVSSCRGSDLSCVLYRAEYGEGGYIVLLGIPPLANALLPLGDNYLFAGAIIDRFSTIAVDEYHHFFTEKTWKDVVATPWVTIPLVVMLIGVIVFHLLGQPEVEARSDTSEITSMSALAFGQAMFGNIIRGPEYFDGLAPIQRDYLIHLFPHQRKQVEDCFQSSNGEERLQKLWALHKQLLAVRGFKA